MDANGRDISDFLAETDLFSGLSTQQIERFAEFAAVERVQSGDFIFAFNQAGAALYILTKGMASIELPLSHDMYAVVQLVGPGKVFGYSCLRPEAAYTTTARSLMNTEVVALPLSEAGDLVGSSPDVAAVLLVNFTMIMNEGLDSMARQLRAPNAPQEESVEQCPLIDGKKFAWRPIPEQIEAHCVRETCTGLEGRDCPLAGQSPLEWHSVWPRLLVGSGGEGNHTTGVRGFKGCFFSVVIEACRFSSSHLNLVSYLVGWGALLHGCSSPSPPASSPRQAGAHSDMASRIITGRGFRFSGTGKSTLCSQALSWPEALEGEAA